ncbi:transketolase-like isoform X2 [Apostichopus japonicus]|uniref:transketolase-like isoform X2 n=1 Tax=Stichopus japonicus TaxID=307972 RepID=UPI003AB25BDE
MAATFKLDAGQRQALEDVANKLRVDSIESTQASGSGHPTTCMSAAEIMSVLFFHTMKYKVDVPKDPANDRFIMSKGHAAPILYAAWAEAGLFPVQNLLNLRKIDSDLEGHPTPRLSFVDVATGSLGQGLSVAAGMAYTGKYLDKADYRTYCLLGDGESAEGSVWEAMAFASYYKLDNLVAIFDVNRLGQSQPTALQHDMDTYRLRCEAFGFNTYIVDGHSIDDLAKALHAATTVKDKPTCILAKTFKGRGAEGIEDKEGWHGKALGAKAEAALAEIKGRIKNQGAHGITINAPSGAVPVHDLSAVKLPSPPAYKKGDKIATRVAYGTALTKLGENTSVVAVDAETKNSTHAEKFMKAHPDRFIECFIAEQNMAGVAMGCACRDRAVVFASAFACFLSRAFDQIRMGAISQTNVNFCGSHCGVSIGEDGPSQMALEDLALFRSVHGSTVFYPSDAVSMERAVEIAAVTKGICFIRSSRPATAVIFDNDEKFEAGKAKVVFRHDDAKATVIGVGITLHEAIEAHDLLAKEGIHINVIDPFTLKPIDKDTIIQAAKASGGKIITVEDHYPQGGLGEAVSSAVAGETGISVKIMAVTELPRSGPPKVLIDMFGISAKKIVEAVKAL